MKNSGLTLFVLLLLEWSPIATASAVPPTVSITVEGTPPPGFTPGGPTEYRAASGPYNFTCTATGGAGAGNYSYVWTSTCAGCTFQTSSTGATSKISRLALHSGDNGTHTCTATRAGESGSDTINVTVVGVGVFVIAGSGESGAQPNNGLVITTDSGHFRFFCRSNSLDVNVGEFNGLDERPVTANSSFGIRSPANGGELNIVGTLTASEQGVYTCRMPLEGGGEGEINIGLYPSGFRTIPSITNPLVFTQGSLSSTVTCISNGSVATTITFVRNDTSVHVGPLRDGESMEFGGVIYQLAQIVTNRAQSTYQNVLTINQPLADIVGSTITCSVENTIGTSPPSQSLLMSVPPAPSVNIVVVSPTSIIIVLSQNYSDIYGVISCTISYERVTGAMQQGPCPFNGHNKELTIDPHGVVNGILIPELEEFSTYAFNITARNAVGPSSPGVQSITTLQAAPSSPPEWVNSTATTSTTITVQWGAVPCIDQNSEITGYKIRYGPVGNSHRTQTNVVNGSASTGGMYTLIGFIPFTNYSIEVAAVNSNDKFGLFATITTATTSIRSSPGIIHLKACNTTAILVTWMALELPGWNVSQYTIYHTTVPGIQGRSDDEHEFPGNTTSGIVPISGVTPNQTHQFQVSGSLDIEGVIYNGARSENQSIIFNLNVSIDVTYNPPNDSIWLDQNEYRAASGPLDATCRVQGTAGAVMFQWSSTCRNCPFQSTNPKSTSSVLHRNALHSGDTGTHTCTVNDNQGSAGTASIVMNIKGAGIHIFHGGPYKQLTSLPNNGLVVSLSDGAKYRFRFFCRSDSMEENVGELIGLDGRTAVTTNSYFNIDNPQPGELQVNNTVNHDIPLPASEQGVYTCRIPLESGEQREINIGLYPNGFNTGPSITGCLVLSPESSSSTLTCTSTGSPATNVTWVKDGKTLTIDGNSYKLVQTVIKRAESTYENVFTINDRLNNTFNHTYTCTVANVLGEDSQDLITMAPPVPDCSAEGASSTSIKLSWRQPPECRVDFFRIAWTTATTQPLPCPKLGASSVDVGSDVTEYILTELEIFHTYTLTITSWNMFGNTTCSQTITTFSASPSRAPERVNIREISSTSITVQWGAVPCMDQNSEIAGYKIRYGPVGSSQRTETNVVTESASTGGVYTLTGLIPFTNYSIEVTAVNSNKDTGPFTHPYFAETLIPTPMNITFEVVNATAVRLSWTKLQPSHLNLSHYTVYYTATKQGRVVDQYRTISSNPTTPSVVVVLRKLMPGLVHQFQVSCSLDTTRGLVEGPRSTSRRFSFDDEFFQLQIGPVEHCITWQPEKAEKNDAIIRHALIEPISCQCNCTFPYEFIRRGIFSCRNTTTKASYRSTIVGTNTYNASQLVNFIQEWVRSGPVLQVEWWLLDVYADCPARISSLNDPECQGPATSDEC